MIVIYFVISDLTLVLCNMKHGHLFESRCLKYGEWVIGNIKHLICYVKLASSCIIMTEVGGICVLTKLCLEFIIQLSGIFLKLVFLVWC